MRHLLRVFAILMCTPLSYLEANSLKDVAAFSPVGNDWSEQLMAQLKLPPKFQINVFAKGLGNARMLAVDNDGTVYLTCPDQGRVLALRDTNGDGRADIVEAAIEELPKVHGIAIYKSSMYLASPQKVWIVSRADGSFRGAKVIINNLPPGGNHPNRTLGIGPDNMLYISVGSTCNACDEGNPESATMLRAHLDGSDRRIFARGLRNTLGFAWHPQTKQLWGMDQGSDWRGNDSPPEELNLLQEGKDYGWPYVYAKQQIDPLMGAMPGNQSKEEYARSTEPAVLLYQAHSSPLQLTFYNARQFPKHYRGGIFIAFRGSWNRYPATGYKVVFIPFKDGKPQGFEDFVSGFLSQDGKSQFGRLAGVAVAADGTLLFCDDANGMLYRVRYKD